MLDNYLIIYQVIEQEALKVDNRSLEIREAVMGTEVEVVKASAMVMELIRTGRWKPTEAPFFFAWQLSSLKFEGRKSVEREKSTSDTDKNWRDKGCVKSNHLQTEELEPWGYAETFLRTQDGSGELSSTSSISTH